MYACDSLGKIQDDRAIPVLKKAFSEKDALIRAYAAHALASFNLSSVIDVLIQGLKDSNWKVRFHCTTALANKDAIAAVDILKYKAKKDPVDKVRIEAIKTLGEIGTKACFDFIRELFYKKIEISQDGSMNQIAPNQCVSRSSGFTYRGRTEPSSFM